MVLMSADRHVSNLKNTHKLTISKVLRSSCLHWSSCQTGVYSPSLSFSLTSSFSFPLSNRADIRRILIVTRDINMIRLSFSLPHVHSVYSESLIQNVKCHLWWCFIPSSRSRVSTADIDVLSACGIFCTIVHARERDPSSLALLQVSFLKKGF